MTEPGRRERKKRSKPPSTLPFHGRKPSLNHVKGGGEGRIYVGIAALVAGLAALVWWSMPEDRPPPSPGEEEGRSAADDGAASQPHTGPLTAVKRPPGASAQFAVVTDRPEEVVRAMATPT